MGGRSRSNDNRKARSSVVKSIHTTGPVAAWAFTRQSDGKVSPRTPPSTENCRVTKVDEVGAGAPEAGVLGSGTAATSTGGVVTEFARG